MKKYSAFGAMSANDFRKEPEAQENGSNLLPFDVVAEAFQETYDRLCQMALTAQIERNTAPTTPDDDAPGTDYPSRTELKPTPVSVPDPAETESATATKISIPDYGDAKRFSVAMGGLAEAASELFEIVSEENQQEKNAARRDALDWLEEVKSSLFDL